MRKKLTNEKRIANLQKDLLKLSQDWEQALSRQKNIRDPDYLKTIAEDIKLLDQDSSAVDHNEEIYREAHMIQHILRTPWGAPFVSDVTLAEAADAFPMQDPLHSDLCHLLDELLVHSNQVDNQFITLMFAISEDLKRKSKH
jgi:hypothetical protein